MMMDKMQMAPEEQLRLAEKNWSLAEEAVAEVSSATPPEGEAKPATPPAELILGLIERIRDL